MHEVQGALGCTGNRPHQRPCQILNQDKEMSAFQILIRDAGQASFSQGAAEPVLQQLDARSLSELPI
jgi:hypothetical protein